GWGWWGRPGAGATLGLPVGGPPRELHRGEDRLTTLALQRRPELGAARAEVEALGDDLTLAGLAWLQGAQFGVAARREPDWSIGPSAALPLPVFDAGSAQQQGVRAELAAARHRATLRGREVVEAVRVALAAPAPA